MSETHNEQDNSLPVGEPSSPPATNDTSESMYDRIRDAYKWQTNWEEELTEISEVMPEWISQIERAMCKASGLLNDPKTTNSALHDTLRPPHTKGKALFDKLIGLEATAPSAEKRRRVGILFEDFAKLKTKWDLMLTEMRKGPREGQTSVSPNSSGFAYPQSATGSHTSSQGVDGSVAVPTTVLLAAGKTHGDAVPRLTGTRRPAMSEAEASTPPASKSTTERLLRHGARNEGPRHISFGYRSQRKPHSTDNIRNDL